METKKRKILIIEDDLYIYDIYKTNLESAGFEVIIADTGTKGIEMPKDINPDLILLDILLPEFNGFEVLKKLKTDPSTSDIPVIILSNLSQKEDVKKAESLGAIDYIIKAGTKPKEVIKKIGNVFLEQ